MSLNSHLQRREQAVASRCVLFDEVTEAYEKLHATVTFWILHRAVDHFRFVVPEGFEITEINSPLLARWDIETEAGRKIVNVRLREQTTDTVVLSIAAVRTPSQLKAWRLPRLELLDVVGQVTVLGLLVEDELKAESLAAKDLIPVDTAVLATALPATLLRPEPGAVPLRYIAAYYAPQGGYELKADFNRAPPTLAVTTSLLLSIQDKGCEVQGGFALLPTAEKRFAFDFSVPAGWTVTEVAGPDKSPLVIERYSRHLSRAAGAGSRERADARQANAFDQAGRVHVKLPQGIAPGQIYVANFRAQYTPPGWLSPWKSQSVEFPMFRVADAQRDEGAVAVTADEDMEVRPEKVERLVPITEAEMARFGMAAGRDEPGLSLRRGGRQGDDRRRSHEVPRHRADLCLLPDRAGGAQGPLRRHLHDRGRQDAAVVAAAARFDPRVDFDPRIGRRKRQGIHQRSGRRDAALERAPGRGPPRRGPPGGRFRNAPADTLSPREVQGVRAIALYLRERGRG